MLFMASGGVNIYHHFCVHGHDDGFVALVIPECHDDVEESQSCCGHNSCGESHDDAEDEAGGCCTNHHEFINVITDFIVEQECNVPELLYVDTDFSLSVIFSITKTESTSVLKSSDPPDIHVFESGRDLVCLIQNFRIGIYHIG